MTESPTFCGQGAIRLHVARRTLDRSNLCGPGAIHAAKVNGEVGAGGLRILRRKWYAGGERSAGISDGRIDGL